ncbi:MAG: hypothetical protein ORN29_10550, partial [Rhodoferax sp.]|nr:hypothetical protein [Rhodoferax sp.]
MALDLDNRQRAMLLEMGVRVWLPLPESGVVTLQRNAAATAVAASGAAQATAQAGRGALTGATSGASTGESRGAERGVSRGAAPVSSAASSAAALGQPLASTYPQRRAFSAKPAAKPAPASVVAPVDLSHIATLDWPTLTEAVRTCQACTLCRTRSHASIAPLTD